MRCGLQRPLAAPQRGRHPCARSRSVSVLAVARQPQRRRQEPAPHTQPESQPPQNGIAPQHLSVDASLAASQEASSPHQSPEAVKASVVNHTLHDPRVVHHHHYTHAQPAGGSKPAGDTEEADSKSIPAGDGPWGRISAAPPLTSVLPLWRLPRSGDDTDALRPLPGYASGEVPATAGTVNMDVQAFEEDGGSKAALPMTNTVLHGAPLSFSVSLSLLRHTTPHRTP